jgi:ABC-type uncharacterized transport system permease subunit
MDTALSITLLTWATMSIRLTMPLLFPALGGVIAEKAGILNFCFQRYAGNWCYQMY